MAICCGTLNGLTLPCDQEFAGGIKQVWMNCYSSITTVTHSAGVITALTPTTGWAHYEFREDTGTVEHSIAVSADNGTKYYENTITLVFDGIETAKWNEINEMAKGYLVMIIEDNNGQYWYYGYSSYVKMTGDSTASFGTAWGDFNGYNLTFLNREKNPPLEVSGTVMTSIIEGEV